MQMIIVGCEWHAHIRGKVVATFVAHAQSDAPFDMKCRIDGQVQPAKRQPRVGRG
jgi:hypothetical protein